MVPAVAFKVTVEPEQATLGVAEVRIEGGAIATTVTAAVVVHTASAAVTI
jgi:hypothetical protein